MTNLTELWLGKNKITKLQGLESLVNLKILSIQVSFEIESRQADFLSEQSHYQDRRSGHARQFGRVLHQSQWIDCAFWIGQAGSWQSRLFAQCVNGLEQTKLRVLDVCANEIEHLENVSHLTELEEFWASLSYQFPTS
jgi:protein phosphatase 1 regulatory subunit 7